jgi:hypothetical protein
MADRLLHGDIQRANLEAHELIGRFKLYTSGAIWEQLSDDQWVKIGELPRESDRRAFLMGRLDDQWGK